MPPYVAGFACPRRHEQIQPATCTYQRGAMQATRACLQMATRLTLSGSPAGWLRAAWYDMGLDGLDGLVELMIGAPAGGKEVVERDKARCAMNMTFRRETMMARLTLTASQDIARHDQCTFTTSDKVLAFCDMNRHHPTTTQHAGVVASTWKLCCGSLGCVCCVDLVSFGCLLLTLPKLSAQNHHNSLLDLSVANHHSPTACARRHHPVRSRSDRPGRPRAPPISPCAVAA